MYPQIYGQDKNTAGLPNDWHLACFGKWLVTCLYQRRKGVQCVYQWVACHLLQLIIGDQSVRSENNGAKNCQTQKKSQIVLMQGQKAKAIFIYMKASYFEWRAEKRGENLIKGKVEKKSFDLFDLRRIPKFSQSQWETKISSSISRRVPRQ